MKEMLIWLLGGIAYALSGLLMVKLTNDYIKELYDKVAKFDVRFAEKLYITINVKSDRAVDIVKTLLWWIWPITCIASILKAEWEFNNVKKHCFWTEP